MRRVFAYVLLALAAALAVWEGVMAAESGTWRLISFGEVFFRLAPEWLNLAQAVVQRYVWAWLWDPAIQTFLLWPAWPVLGGVGAVLWLIRRRRRR